MTEHCQDCDKEIAQDLFTLPDFDNYGGFETPTAKLHIVETEYCECDTPKPVNKYETLKRATDEFSAEDARNAAICIRLAIGWLDSNQKQMAKDCANRAEAYADIMEGKHS